MSACSRIEDHLLGKGQSVMWVTVRRRAKFGRARRLRDRAHTITATAEGTSRIGGDKLRTFKAVHRATLVHSQSLTQS